jgi:hypothetical protein
MGRTASGAYRTLTDSHLRNIIDAPDEPWAALDHALRFGKRTLPSGGSLAKLLATDALRPLDISRESSRLQSALSSEARAPQVFKQLGVGAAGIQQADACLLPGPGRGGLRRAGPFFIRPQAESANLPPMRPSVPAARCYRNTRRLQLSDRWPARRLYCHAVARSAVRWRHQPALQGCQLAAPGCL